MLLVAVLAAMVCAPPAWSQTLAKLKGKVTDFDGKPVAGATVELTNSENGRKYSYKTDKNGEYLSIAVESGTYDAKLIKDGKVLATKSKIPVNIANEENVVNFDLGKDRQKAVAAMPPEQKQQMEQAQREKEKLLGLNAMLAQSRQAQQAGDYDGAVNILRKATQTDPTKALLWARLGEAEFLSAKKTTDRTAALGKYQATVESYKKALEAPNTGPGALVPADLVIVYRNLGESYARLGRDKDALASCERLAALPGGNAGHCYYNVGASLTNAGKIDSANTAFDKAIAADPNFADAYYQKGVNLLGKATVDKNGHMVAAPEVATDLNKYLELAPNGPYAQPAKELLAGIGGKVQTS